MQWAERHNLWKLGSNLKSESGADVPRGSFLTLDSHELSLDVLKLESLGSARWSACVADCWLNTTLPSIVPAATTRFNQLVVRQGSADAERAWHRKYLRWRTKSWRTAATTLRQSHLQ